MRLFVDCVLLSEDNIRYLAQEMGIQPEIFKKCTESHQRFLAYIGEDKDTTHYLFTSASAAYDRNTHYYLSGDDFVAHIQQLELLRLLQ